MNNINEGKKFENAWKASVPDCVYYQRIKDPAQSFTQSDTLRFSPQNPYDCFMYLFPNLFTLELKSTESTSMTFYRDDFISENTKPTFMIKKNQIKGLLESKKHKGIVSGFILNFRKFNHTYFLDIDDFINMTCTLNKKSFNEADVASSHGLLIEQVLKKVNYKYNIEKFIQEFLSPTN